MTDVQNILKEAIKTGYSILVELDKEDPDVEKLQELYTARADVTDKLESVSGIDADALEDEEREAIDNLFMRLELLEKELNKKLRILSNTKRRALNKLQNHRKAEDSYSKASQQHSGQQSQIVDIVYNK